tara:strand:+ start:427 stop:1860 length:1434 start_codon:yes stop_codon:yes gene_type:complete
MSWRNRKMFYDLPQGIVSGLAPIPRYKEGGFVNPIDYRAGGTVDYPVGMEAGSLVPEVFQEGDQQINEALNTMLATAMPTGDATTSLPIEEPTGAVEELLPESETKDPSSKQRLFIVEVNEQKKILQETIEKVVAEKSEGTIEDPIALKAEITDFINKADSLFKKKVTDIANKLDVQVMPEQITLLTDEFANKLETMFPSVAALEPDDTEIVTMEHGGEVNAAEIQRLTIEKSGLEKQLETMPEDTRRQTREKTDVQNKIRNLEKQIALLKHPPTYSGGQQDRPSKIIKEAEDTEVITTGDNDDKKTPSLTTELPPADSSTNPDIADLLARNAESIRRAAMMTGKTKQGGYGGFFDVYGQAQMLGDKAERENILKQYEIDSRKDLFRQEADIRLFNQLAEFGIDDAKEQFLLSGKELPDAYGISHPKGERAFQGNLISFRDYYLAVKASEEGQEKTYSQIEAEFNGLPTELPPAETK